MAVTAASALAQGPGHGPGPGPGYGPGGGLAALNLSSEQQKKVDDLRRQMLASRIETRSQIEQVLTPEQRKQFRSFGPWWMQEEGE